MSQIVRIGLACASRTVDGFVMRKQFIKALTVLASMLVAVAWWQALRPREPRYLGRPLSAWLADLDLTVWAPPNKAVQAAIALRAIGTNSLPWLAHMLQADDQPWNRAALALNAGQSMVQLPVRPASLDRARAIEGYAVLGGDAAVAVPELIRLMDSKTAPQVRSCVAAALGRIGPEARAAIPVLQRATHDNNAEVCKSARLALSNIHMWATPDRLTW